MTDEAGERSSDIETLRAFYAHWARGEFGNTDAWAEDVVFVSTGLDQGEFRGPDEIRQVWRGYLQAWRDFRVKALEVIPGAEGKYVVIQLFTGTGKSSGIESEERTAACITMRDGKIVRMEGYWDRDEAFRAAGIEAP